jgi:predicted DsbA family dithiol-disulfide isomerase
VAVLHRTLREGHMASTIHVFSDVVCPWCYLGKRRLERALDATGLRDSVAITWLPFELNPDMPPDGMERAAYRARKFGAERSAELDARMTALGREDGVDFAFDRMRRTPSTRRAHLLVAFANRHGAGNGVVDALFAAYFKAGLDIGDPAVLLQIASEAGLDREQAEAALDDPDLAAEVAGLEGQAARMGIGGVPFFILEGGQAVSGAQPAEDWERILRSVQADPGTRSSP